MIGEMRKGTLLRSGAGLWITCPCCGLLPNPFAEILWREWEDFSAQSDAQGLEAGDGPQFQFTLMSYNILAQDLMQQSSELYLHCHPDILNWNYRFANLMQEFQHWDPDVSEEGGRAVLHLLWPWPVSQCS